MKRSLKILAAFLTISLVLLPASVSFAASPPKLDGVVVEVGTDKVVVGLGAYAIAFNAGQGNQLFDYLRAGKAVPKIYAVKSGNKYIGLGQYAARYSENPANAIKNSAFQALTTVNTYKRYKGFDGSGSPILENVQQGPTVSDIYFQGVEQVIGSDNKIIIYVSPDTLYTSAKVTLSHDARVRVYNNNYTSKKVLVEAGEIEGNEALELFKPNNEQAYGSTLINESPITVELTGVNGYGSNIEGAVTVYTVEFKPMS